MDRLYILAIAIVIAGALSGGVYSVAGTGTGGSIMFNRFTGSSWYCAAPECFPVKPPKISN
jgi:hypothetical protein